MPWEARTQRRKGMFYTGCGGTPRFLFHMGGFSGSLLLVSHAVPESINQTRCKRDRIKWALLWHILAHPSLRDFLLVWKYHIFPAETQWFLPCLNTTVMAEGMQAEGSHKKLLTPATEPSDIHSWAFFVTSFCFLKSNRIFSNQKRTNKQKNQMFHLLVLLGIPFFFQNCSNDAAAHSSVFKT